MLSLPERWQAELRQLAGDLEAALVDHDGGASADEDPFVLWEEMEFRVTRALFFSALTVRKFKESQRVASGWNWGEQHRFPTRSSCSVGPFRFAEVADGSERKTLVKLCDELVHSAFFDFVWRYIRDQQPDQPQICGFLVCSDHNRRRVLEVSFDRYLGLIRSLSCAGLGPPRVVE